MRITGALIGAGAIALSGIACGGSDAAPAKPPAAHVVDLGHALAATDPTWGGEPVFTYTQLDSMAKSGYAAGRFATDEHFGTHVDAPAHFGPGGLTVDQIPAGRLVRPAVCVNVATQVAANEDYQVTVADLEDFERRHGAIPEGALVLVATGWDARWPDHARYMNVREKVKHFPGISVEAATFLAKQRRVAAIGIDTPSIDYGPSAAFEAHHATQVEGVYHIENAAALTSLPPTGFIVVVAPVKVAGGSGAPARVFALLPPA